MGNRISTSIKIETSKSDNNIESFATDWRSKDNDEWNSPSQVRNFSFHHLDKLEEWSKKENQTIGGFLIDVDMRANIQVEQEEELFQYDVVEVPETESDEESSEESDESDEEEG